MLVAWAVPEQARLVRRDVCRLILPLSLTRALVLRSLRETSHRPSITIIRVYKSTRVCWNFNTKNQTRFLRCYFSLSYHTFFSAFKENGGVQVAPPAPL